MQVAGFVLEEAQSIRKDKTQGTMIRRSCAKCT